jgi:hypothetical protein
LALKSEGRNHKLFESLLTSKSAVA